MSNCSEHARLPAPCDGEALRPLARTLEGVAEECAWLGREVTRIGAVVADIANAVQSDIGMMELQAFDYLVQHAHAQSKLIAHLAWLLMRGEGGSEHDMLAQIDDVPLPAVRSRLRLALGVSQVERDDDSDSILWDEPPEDCTRVA